MGHDGTVREPAGAYLSDSEPSAPDSAAARSPAPVSERAGLQNEGLPHAAKSPSGQGQRDAEIQRLRQVEAALRAAHRQAAAQLRALLDIGEASASNLTLAEFLRKILRSVTSLLGAPAAAVWRIDHQGTLQRLSYVGLSQEYVQAVTTLEVGEGVTGLVALTAHPLAVADVAHDPRVRFRPLWEQEHIGSFLAAPLLQRGQPAGVLSVYRRDVHKFAATEVALLVSFATQAALALENALLYARTGRAEAAASSHRELLESVVSHAEDGILALDADWRILLFSPGCERITGWTASEAAGRSCFEVLDAYLASGARLDTQTLASTAELIPQEHHPTRPGPTAPGAGHPQGEPYLEAHLRTRQGQKRWVGASLARVAAGRRGSPRIVLVLRDITAAKEMDELKSALISTVSHELRTPLTSLRALSELLLDHVLDPGQSRELATHIHGESVRLSRLVDNILDVTRIEAGRLPYDPQHLEVISGLREAVDTLRAQIAEHGLDVQVADARSLPPVLADADHFRRVVENLLSNALRYVPMGGTIHLAARRLAVGDDDFVEIAVRDDGPGIAPEHRRRVFDKFYRIGDGEQPRSGGTGLGLYIARNLVELMGGQISVSSEPGQGATFRFTLPMAEPAHE